MFLRSKAQPVRKADDLTALREPTAYKMWDLLHLTTLQASTASLQQ
jgi:hypothetical protein